jgi:endoglucanase Acf2
MSLQTFSQTLVLNEKNDTTICFSLAKGKYLLKQTYKVAECDTLRKICEVQRLMSDSVILEQSSNIADYKIVIDNQKNMLWMKDNQIDNLKLELEGEKRATKLQKVYKWVAIIGGGALSGYLGYKYVTK